MNDERIHRTSVLSRWAVWAGTHPWKAIALALIISAILGIGASMLTMEMTFFSLMPQDSTQVRDIKRITENYPFASAIVVVVDARDLPESQRKSAVMRAIDGMTEELQSDDYSAGVAGVYGRVDTEFLEEHAFMLTETDVLERMTRLYADVNLIPFLRALNDDLEREYTGDGEALEDDEGQLVSWVGGVELILASLAGSLEGQVPEAAELTRALDAYFIGDPYYLSRNEDLGMFFIKPTYTVNDLGPLVTETDMIEKAVKSMAADYGVQAGLTGFLVVGRDEMVTSEQGFAVSMLVALILILALMITVFRIRSTPLIVGIPLLLGIFWTAGMTGFLIQRLNILTAMYLVALLGLGVDYAIHLMTGFVQERDSGQSFKDAVGRAFARSGRGIVTGALTTAAAFFAMLFAGSQIVRELAVVAGTGILCELAAMFILIPAILGRRERRLEKKGKDDPMLRRRRRIRSDFAGGLGHRVQKRPMAFALGLLAVGGILAIWAPRVELEDNLMNMEAKGLESVELQDTLVDEFGTAPDVLYLIVDNEDRDKLPPVIDALEDLDSVKYVDAITKWWPTDAQNESRLPYLEQLRRDRIEGVNLVDPEPELLLEELYRLEANLVEMGDLAVLGGTDRAAFALNRATGLDNDGRKIAESVFDQLFSTLESWNGDQALIDAAAEFQNRFSREVAERVVRMAGSSSIGLEDLPEMTRDTLMARDDRSSLVTISPRQNPWEGRYRNVFTAQVGSVSDRGTGMILAADQLIAIAESDSVRSLVAALVAVFLILLLDFRNLRITLLTFLPLGLSFASLYGLMAIFEIKFDFINIIAIPLLVGIGIDDSVHINHRYLMEGKGRMAATLAGTGTAVALTTLTTMIGFSSFIPSIMRAMRSTGIVLTLAMALAFVYSVLFHPALLVLVSEKLGWNLYPRFLHRKVNNEK